MIVILAVLFFSLVVMIVGAELLVRGASRLAAMFGVSQLIIGLTIVAFGTSAPEFLVSLKGSLSNHSDLVVGNCIGSNIFNLLLILGACAIVAPLVVTDQLIKIDVPVMIGGTLFFFFLSIDGIINWFDGILLITIFTLYYGFVVHKSLLESTKKKTSHHLKSDYTLPLMIKQITFIASGLILCITGANWFVDSSITLARVLGLSELVIGLTIVSIGTSLPELATSIVATIRGKCEIAIGNVVGSSIFNILAVSGVASLFSPQGITVAPSILRFDLPVVIVVSIAYYPILLSDNRISRREGLLFVFSYIAYMIYKVVEAQKSDVLLILS